MFDRVKRIYWNLWLDFISVKHGRLFSCISPCYIWCKSGGKLSFGDNLSLNHNVTIDASDGGEITIGNNVYIAMNSVLRAANHDYIKAQGHIARKIVIGDNVWIAANCVVLPGVTVGSGSVIGAGSIVTKDIPENVVAVGNPCKPIKKIIRKLESDMTSDIKIETENNYPSWGC